MKYTKKIVSVLLCIMSAFLLLWAVIGFSLKEILSKESIDNILSVHISSGKSADGGQQKNAQNALDQISNGDFDPKTIDMLSEALTKTVGDFITGEGSSDNLSDAVYEALSKEEVTTYLGDRAITRVQVESFVENSTLTDFFVDYGSSFAQSITEGEKPKPITAGDVKALISDNKKILEDTFDVSLDSEVMAVIDSAIDENNSAIETMTTIDFGNDDSQLNSIIHFTKVFFSDTNLILALCGSIVLLLLTIVINKKPTSFLIYGGVSFVVIAVILGIISAVSGVFTDFLPQSGLVGALGNQLVSSGAASILGKAIITLCIGVVLTGGYIAVKIIFKKGSQVESDTVE